MRTWFAALFVVGLMLSAIRKEKILRIKNDYLDHHISQLFLSYNEEWAYLYFEDSHNSYLGGFCEI